MHGKYIFKKVAKKVEKITVMFWHPSLYFKFGHLSLDGDYCGYYFYCYWLPGNVVSINIMVTVYQGHHPHQGY